MVAGWTPSPRAMARRTTHDGLAPDSPPAQAGNGYRSVSIAVHPFRDSSLLTVVVRDHVGRDRWDRRDGTMTLDLSRDDLSGLRTADMLKLICNHVLDALRS